MQKPDLHSDYKRTIRTGIVFIVILLIINAYFVYGFVSLIGQIRELEGTIESLRSEMDDLSQISDIASTGNAEYELELTDDEIDEHMETVIRLDEQRIAEFYNAEVPYIEETATELETDTDVMLILDLSPSMMAGDFNPNRLEVIKDGLDRFLSRLSGCRVGIIVFSGMAFTHCPLSADMAYVREYLTYVNGGSIDLDGTAIGDAMMLSLARLRDSDASRKISILLTDGEHNKGTYYPRIAAQFANRLDVNVSAVGIGGSEPVPVPDPQNPGQFLTDFRDVLMFTTLDESTLQEITDSTGGDYFRAENERMLSQVFDEIETLLTD